jgi:hypothetical protein
MEKVNKETGEVNPNLIYSDDELEDSIDESDDNSDDNSVGEKKTK